MSMFGRIGKLIGHGGGHHDWLSRDYLDIDCKATGCMFNRDEKCMVPSRAKIGPDGRCEGFQVPPTKKIEGD
jgi:hypothetical protein